QAIRSLPRSLFQVRLERADILELRQLVAGKLHTKCLLNAEHQVDVVDRIPLRDVLGGHVIAQCQGVVAKNGLENFFKSLVRTHGGNWVGSMSSSPPWRRAMPTFRQRRYPDYRHSQ